MIGKNHNFIYFGTPKVARDTLAALLAHGYVPALVVTSPDAPRGRGLVLTPSETKSTAIAHSIPVITPTVLDEATITHIASYGAEYAIVVAYGKIFSESLISIFPKGVLNVHYSLLPKYRGATPLESALLAGDTTTGVTIQKMVKELDAGDIIAQNDTKIGPLETARELRPRLIDLGAELLVATLPRYLDGTITPRAQDNTLVSKSHKIRKEDGLLLLSDPAESNWNKYRAYADSVGTYFFATVNGTAMRIKIVTASYKHGIFTPEKIVPEGRKETDYSIFAINNLISS